MATVTLNNPTDTGDSVHRGGSIAKYDKVTKVTGAAEFYATGSNSDVVAFLAPSSGAFAATDFLTPQCGGDNFPLGFAPPATVIEMAVSYVSASGTAEVYLFHKERRGAQ